VKFLTTFSADIMERKFWNSFKIELV